MHVLPFEKISMRFNDKSWMKDLLEEQTHSLLVFILILQEFLDQVITMFEG